jgi:thymidylate kinase
VSERLFTVALVGPDGAGKTTVAKRLEDLVPFPVAYLYMGVSTDSSNSLLPTTRLVRAVKRRRGAAPDTAGPRDHREVTEAATAASTRSRTARAASAARATARLVNRLAEEYHRQWLAWRRTRRGELVVFDRHFFADYHAYDIAVDGPLPLSRRIHGWLLARAYPKPDMTVYLDAPADVLLARKGEGSRDVLERRRRDYLALDGATPNFAVVDATLPLDDVCRRVAALIVDHAHRR